MGLPLSGAMTGLLLLDPGFSRSASWGGMEGRGGSVGRERADQYGDQYNRFNIFCIVAYLLTR